jgi:hypothetical protein
VCNVRLVRLGAETSKVGADVRAALASWGPTDSVLGGIALLGITVADRPIEALLLLPRGVLVVVGVDLPDPAMRLDAPLTGQWKADGWPLVRPDGAVNPAAEAQLAGAAVARLLQDGRTEPVPVGTVIAVGPYFSQVVQPTVDLHRGVRVLHPQPKSLLAAVRELAVHERACSVEQARALLAALAGTEITPTVADLTAEGFPDVVARDMASARTTLLPKITEPPRAPRPRQSGGPNRWLPVGALILLGVLLITGIVLAAVSSSGHDAPALALTPTSTAQPSKVADVTVNGVRFSPQGFQQDQNCAAHAYGDVQVWLSQHTCQTMARSLYQTALGGRTAAVAQTVVSFADATTAKAFAVAAGTPGGGGVDDLVKDGQGWPGGPKTFDDAAYSVTAANTSVRLIEVVWIGQPSSPTDPNLTKLAGAALGLPAVP